jgi:hypothetical protein
MKADDPRVQQLRQLHCDTHDADLSPRITPFESGDVEIRWNGCCDDIRKRAKEIAEPPPPREQA